MLTITNEITNMTYILMEKGSSFTLKKDIWDYAGILGTTIAPIIAIVFSMWNNIHIKRIRHEDLIREDELREKSELKDHYQNINKFIDDQLYVLNKITDQEFMNLFIKLQSLISKCGMITRDKTRDCMIYYISTYIEVSYFLQTDTHIEQKQNIGDMRILFLNSIKEFDILLIDKDITLLQQRIQELLESLKFVCIVKN